MELSPAEYAAYYGNYIKLVGPDVLQELRKQETAFPGFIRNIPVHKGDFAYAEGKWTVKEVLGHLLDTERIMTYRALRLSRMDQTPLAGFAENDYAACSCYHERSMESLASEFAALRSSNLFLFTSFNEAELKRAGTASGHPVSVRALLFIIAGHLYHHKRILEERYL